MHKELVSFLFLFSFLVPWVFYLKNWVKVTNLTIFHYHALWIFTLCNAIISHHRSGAADFTKLMLSLLASFTWCVLTLLKICVVVHLQLFSLKVLTFSQQISVFEINITTCLVRLSAIYFSDILERNRSQICLFQWDISSTSI